MRHVKPIKIRMCFSGGVGRLKLFFGARFKEEIDFWCPKHDFGAETSIEHLSLPGIQHQKIT
jgi:hypothetical protein